MSYASLSLRTGSEIVQHPRSNTYQQLRERYSETLQCSYSRISVAYGKFAQMKPVLHQVCSNDFISQDLIDFAFVANPTVTWPMGERASRRLGRIRTPPIDQFNATVR